MGGHPSHRLTAAAPAQRNSAIASTTTTASTAKNTKIDTASAVLDVPGAGGPGFGCRDPDEYCWEAGGLGVDDSGCGVDIRVGDMPRRVSGRSREP